MQISSECLIDLSLFLLVWIHECLLVVWATSVLPEHDECGVNKHVCFALTVNYRL